MIYAYRGITGATTVMSSLYSVRQTIATDVETRLLSWNWMTLLSILCKYFS